MMAIALIFLAIGQLAYSQEANQGRAASSEARDKIIAELRSAYAVCSRFFPPARTCHDSIRAIIPPSQMEGLAASHGQVESCCPGQVARGTGHRNRVSSLGHTEESSCGAVPAT
jgi:hypothetical protein